MGNAAHCSSRGSSGWDITFTPEGEYQLTKHGQTHIFPDHDSVRHFLMGYEIAHDVYNDGIVSVGSLKIEVDKSELDDALHKARELEDVMKSLGMCDGDAGKFKAIDPNGDRSALFNSESDARAWANFCNIAYGVYSMEIVEVK